MIGVCCYCLLLLSFVAAAAVGVVYFITLIMNFYNIFCCSTCCVVAFCFCFFVAQVLVSFIDDVDVQVLLLSCMYIHIYYLFGLFCCSDAGSFRLLFLSPSFWRPDAVCFMHSLCCAYEYLAQFYLFISVGYIILLFFYAARPS